MTRSRVYNIPIARGAPLSPYGSCWPDFQGQENVVGLSSIELQSVLF